MCLLRAGYPSRAGDTAKSGQFIGKFTWVTGDPICVNRLKLNSPVNPQFAQGAAFR